MPSTVAQLFGFPICVSIILNNAITTGSNVTNVSNISNVFCKQCNVSKTVSYVSYVSMYVASVLMKNKKKMMQNN